MEVYSDRISVDQDEQERLRFSPDDVVKLPVHRAINLWVADGVPRGGFMAQTLPMEELFDENVAESHLAAQHDRGAFHPEYLPDPIGPLKDEDDDPDDGAPAQPPSPEPAPKGPSPGGALPQVVPGSAPGEQGKLIEDVG